MSFVMNNDLLNRESSLSSVRGLGATGGAEQVCDNTLTVYMYIYMCVCVCVNVFSCLVQ